MIKVPKNCEIILATKLIKKRKLKFDFNKNQLDEVLYFHFKGFYNGEKIDEVIFNWDDSEKYYESFREKDDYILFLNEVKIYPKLYRSKKISNFKNVMTGRIIASKNINDLRIDF